MGGKKKEKGKNGVIGARKVAVVSVLKGIKKGFCLQVQRVRWRGYFCKG